MITITQAAKRVLAITLSLILALAFVQVPAFAVESIEVDGSGTKADPWLVGKESRADLQVYVDGTKLYVEGTGDMLDFGQSRGDRAPWLVDGYAQDSNKTVKSIIIGEGVAGIGTYAFMNFSELTSIDFGGTCAKIGANSFTTCSDLAKLEIPANITEIDEGAFADCVSLRNIYYAHTPDDPITVATGCYAVSPDYNIDPPIIHVLNKELLASSSIVTANSGTYVNYYEIPSKVKNLKTASSTASSIKLSWSAGPDTDISGYVVRRLDSESGEYVAVKTVKGRRNTSCAVKGLDTPATAYKFQVYAYITCTKFNDYCLVGKPATITAATACNGVGTVKVKAAGKTLKVSWKKASGVTGYELYYSTKSSMAGAKTVKITGASKVTAKIKKLKSKKKYYVRVRGYVKLGSVNSYSSWSKKISATIK